jgi:hypothetical protein
MGKPPFFTVIVPTYNQAQYLGQALDSLLAQTDPDWEAMVVNDGSTDSTGEVIDAYCRKDSRFRAFHKENGGVASALNIGLREARGKWICWLSSDDLFETKKLEVHRLWIAKYPGCYFFYSHFKYLYDTTGLITYPYLRKIRDRRWQVLEMLRLNFIHGNSICVQRDAWVRAGMFNEELRYGQDYDMWLRLLALYPATFIPQRTCITRQHALQECKTFPKATRFDSAKAAINFINEHTFAGLVPHVDLGDVRKARKAIVKALDVAADPSGFVYMLGPHPALILRILEWAWGGGASEATAIKQTVQRWASEISCQYSGTAFGFLWKAIAAASELPGYRFDYQTFSPAGIAEASYWLLKSEDNKKADELHRYLEKFEKLPLPEDGVASQGKGQEVVIICQEGTDLSSLGKDNVLQSTVGLARNLIKTGSMVLLIGLSSPRMGFIDGVMFVGVDSRESLEHAIGSLRPIDVLVSISRPYIGRMPCAPKYLNVPTLNKLGLPESVRNGLTASELGTSLWDILDGLPVRKSKAQVMFCLLSRRGQMRGVWRQMTRRLMLTRRRTIEMLIIVLQTLSATSLAQWLRALKDLWAVANDKGK